ncbi:MAG: SDR family oxidoreductase [Phycisphaerales bacterium]
MPWPLQQQPVALITGAGSGIGREVAFELAGRGYAVCLVGRTESKLNQTAERVSSNAEHALQPLVLAVDIALPESASVIIDRISAWAGRLDALINNAGIAPLYPIAATSFETLQEVFLINTIGPARLIAEAWPLLIAGEFADRQPSACVVNVSTIGTIDPFPGFFAYAASKSALESFTRSIVVEGAEHNVRAFSVAPGAVETPLLRSLFDEAMLPRELAMSPGHVANVIAACVMGERDQDSGRVITMTQSS